MPKFGWKHFASKPPDWWNPPSPDPFVRDQLRRIRTLLRNSRPTSVLEVGVGRGRITPWIQGPWPYIGVEVNNALMTEACKCVPDPLILASGTHLPFRERSFDAVVSFDVFMHVWQREMFLRECRRVLKPNGILVINFLRRFSRGWGKYMLGWARRPLTTWRSRDRHYDTTRAVELLLSEIGFSTQVLMGETSVPIICATRT